ncbi:arylesterase [Pusillimonas noertemannii]|uniref:Acyl-CoA thioesterase-1 n=1 Tax=Pusillimonas noertemannii TaxID=305977 RepID=A0A2U1CJV7_9BURK|nr:arylesterase [Pusillimonas noertemannii]PVY61283.1 acyl-CoA thioesterase-1 [Pusillimonas noertemannii]TFL09096.1 arylesterase [Pusillimonas noertemannii]
MHTRWKLLIASLLLLGWLGGARAENPQPSNHNILVIGDSLSAEYGIRRDSGWVRIIQQRLQQEAADYTMRNASISGDTTSGGLSRMPAALERYRPAIVVIELGSNDALRGLPLDMTRGNLARMIALAKDAGARVVLAGMQIPPNYGRPYSEQFRTLFVDLAKEHETGFVPFLLEGVALDRTLFQDDGMHPNEEAQSLIADNVWAVLGPMVAG